MVRRQKQNVSLVTVWSLDLLVFPVELLDSSLFIIFHPERTAASAVGAVASQKKRLSNPKRKKADDALIDLPVSSSSSSDSREFGFLICSRSFPLLLLPTTPEKNTTLHSTRAGGGRGTQPLTGLTDSFFPLAAYNILRVLSVHFLYTSQSPAPSLPPPPVIMSIPNSDIYQLQTLPLLLPSTLCRTSHDLLMVTLFSKANFPDALYASLSPSLTSGSPSRRVWCSCTPLCLSLIHI